MAGMVVAVFDVAVESRNNSVDIKSTALNILKGFFACSLIGVVPIDLYKFCVTLQNVFMRDISSMVASSKSVDLAEVGLEVLQSSFSPTPSVKWTLLLLVSKMDFAVVGQYDCLCLLCREDFLCQHQAWRNTSGADCSRFTVYVQRAERVSGRLQSVDKTGNRHLSDSVFTDITSVSRNVDIHR